MSSRNRTRKPATQRPDDGKGLVGTVGVDDAVAALKEPRPDIEVGDYVYVGENGEVHWEVEHMHRLAKLSPGYPHVRLRSGMTGRTRIAAYGDLRLHSKGKGDARD